MQVVLVMFRNDGERRSFSVVRNMTVIGRREDCDLRIPVGDVSRKHCRLLSSEDGVSIEDLGSSNGTFVNHERIQHRDLNAGDTIGVGPVQFVVQIDGVPDEDEMTAPTAMPAGASGEDDSAAGYKATTVQDEPGQDDAGQDDAGQDDAGEHELVAEEEPLEEIPAEEEEMQAEELAVEEEPLEELPADELALDELTEEAEPLEELPAEELSAEALSDDENPVEQSAEQLTELEETIIPGKASTDLPLAAASADVDNLEDLELDEEPPVPGSASGKEDLTMPPPGHTHGAVEELHLDEEHPAAAHPGEKTAEGSAWDFVIEETESEHSTRDIHIDLDAPHHQQPHQ
jgi:pSer/pThr/pTyr-binding forkhead associated (FHA) protein